ncbi:MAG TPA: Maf family protein [Burkholderiaceae bacterium]|nr:Maf family protein [Burkholderiaceae bacterium]
MNLVYLASQSPRRRQLLTQIGVHHELLLPDPHEDAEALEAALPAEGPEDYVQRVTLAKMQAARERALRRALVPAPILCADTTVVLDDALLGKPCDDADAARMLAQLSGRTHRVLSAVAVVEAAHNAFEPRLALSVSSVRMRALEADEILRYVASGESQGKAGAYAIQSQAAAWIESIEGSYSGIMGLPLFETAQLLRHIGWQL